jgi:hypothetical protein
MRGRFWGMLVLVSLLVSLVPSTSLASSSRLDQTGEFQMQEQEELRTIDDRFAEIAQQVPEFGGMFYDENGQLTMYLVGRDVRGDRVVEPTPMVQTPEVGREKVDEATQMAKAAIVTLMSDDPRITSAGEIRALRGQYGFLQLKEWFDSMNMVVHGVPGVVLTDIDEVSNRLRIGIENQEVQGAVEEQLAQLRIPQEAVIIEVTGPLHAAATLRQKRPSKMGGLQIRFPLNLFEYGECTLGFIANRAGVRGMVTNSHCTKTQGGIEGTAYYQATISGDSYLIARETVDPAYLTGGACPIGRRCRYSDAAFARIPHPSGPAVNGPRGFIARTTGANDNSITIDPANPRFRIVSEANSFPLAGQILNKVGRATGWTQGQVSNTCAWLSLGDKNITFICQVIVNAGMAQGDSGAPVFALGSTSHQSRVGVSATTAWQQTPLTLQQGNQFTVSYNSGTWTVDARNFPFVGPQGYSLAIDQQIWQGCKVDLSVPYSRLLGKVGSGPTFSVGRGGTFTANGTGSLYLRINDWDSCLSDNAGSVSMTVFGPPQATSDVSLYGIAWATLNGTQFIFSTMNEIQLQGELGPLLTCQSNFSC